MFAWITAVTLFVGGFRPWQRWYHHNDIVQNWQHERSYLLVREPTPGCVVLESAKQEQLTLVFYRLVERQPQASKYERVLIPLPAQNKGFSCYHTGFEFQRTLDSDGEEILINGTNYAVTNAEIFRKLRATVFTLVSKCGTCMQMERTRPANYLTRVPLKESIDVTKYLHSHETFLLLVTRLAIAEQLPQEAVAHD